MKVLVLRSFASTQHGSFQQGAVVDMPEGADWVEAGHAEPVEESDGDLFQAGEAESGATEGADTSAIDVSEYHTGGGWYDVPGSDKKVRKDEAEEILREADNG